MIQGLAGLESRWILTGKGQHYLKSPFLTPFNTRQDKIISLTLLMLSHIINTWQKYKSDLSHNVQFSYSDEKTVYLGLAMWPWLVLNEPIN